MKLAHTYGNALHTVRTFILVTLGAFAFSPIGLNKLPSSTHAAAFASITVNDLGDAAIGGDGKCTLREAITNANTNTQLAGSIAGDCAAGAGVDTITFTGAGIGRIAPATVLPPIIEGLTIDGIAGTGATCPAAGMATGLRVELDGGGGAFDGLIFTSLITNGPSVVRGLVIRNFGRNGILTDMVGSANPANFITIQCNYIGTDVTGNIASPNGNNGILLGFSRASIVERNLLSGNHAFGVDVFGAGENTKITGNYLGTNLTGTAALGNLMGVFLANARQVTVGGTTAPERNLMSGNAADGIRIIDNTTGGNNRVIGNFIGTDASGNNPLGNQGFGVSLSSQNATIGGTLASESNVIAFNNSHGIYVFGDTLNPVGNRFLGNSIYRNRLGGIDIFPNGITPNDTNDPDTGSNNLQNYPVLNDVMVSGGQTTVLGTLNSLANQTFRLEFFLNDTCDASGFGQGKTFLGFQNVTTTGNNASFTVTFPITLIPGQAITATATRLSAGAPVETSEFSACLMLDAPANQNLVPPVSDQHPGSVLVFPYYSSIAANASTQNTRIALTNTHTTSDIFVHLFFVDGATCSVADSFLCLTANQTASFTAADVDPGTTGYLVAVATDSYGCPANFNYLIGDEYVKLASGHTSNLGAEAISAAADMTPACSFDNGTATLALDGIHYSAMPRVLAAANLPARADGNDTLLVIDRIGGNLATSAAPMNGLFGLLYDDVEQAFSFQLAASGCQLVTLLNNSTLRTVPRYETIIPAGRSGWLKLWHFTDAALLGAQINANPTAFRHGHNLHKLTLTNTVTLTIPVFAPSC